MLSIFHPRFLHNYRQYFFTNGPPCYSYAQQSNFLTAERQNQRPRQRVRCILMLEFPVLDLMVSHCRQETFLASEQRICRDVHQVKALHNGPSLTRWQDEFLKNVLLLVVPSESFLVAAVYELVLSLLLAVGATSHNKWHESLTLSIQ